MTNRPTAEERRNDYLRIGLEMISEFEIEHPPEVAALADIRVSDVARRAGVSKGALYHIWPSQEAYRQDLLTHLLDERELQGIDPTGPGILGAEGGGVTDWEAIRSGTAGAYERLLSDHRYLTRFGFALYAADADVQPLLGRAISMEMDSALPSVEASLARLGRRVREPFTLEYLTTAMAMMLNGYIIQGRLTPALVPATILSDGHGEWTAFGTACRSLIEHFTESDDTPSGRTREDHLQHS